MRRGEVWWASLPPPWGRRPVLLLARDEAYGILTWVAAAPLTTRIRNIPSAVPVTPNEDGVPQRSVVSLDSIMLVRSDWPSNLIARLRPAKMEAVDRAIHFALGLRN